MYLIWQKKVKIYNIYIREYIIDTERLPYRIYSLSNHMVNKLQNPTKKNWVSKFFKSVLLTGTTLLFLLQPWFSKNNDKVKAAIKETLEQYDTKTYQVQENNDTQTYTFDQSPNTLDWGNDVLSYATNNVKKYYPDMEKHLNDMINRFGNDTERRDIVIQIFGETIMKIQDPKQRIGAIIYALEGYVFRESDFGDVHDSDITDATYTIMEQAEKKYNTWLKARLVDLEKINADIKKHQQELVKHQQELAKNQQELDKTNQQMIDILNKVSVQDVKTKENIRQMVIEAKILFFKYKTEINPHIDELFTLVP